MVSKPIIPEETLVKVRDAVHVNKKEQPPVLFAIVPPELKKRVRDVILANKTTKKGPQNESVWLREAAEEKLDRENITPDRPEPQPQGENIG